MAHTFPATLWAVRLFCTGAQGGIQNKRIIVFTVYCQSRECKSETGFAIASLCEGAGGSDMWCFLHIQDKPLIDTSSWNRLLCWEKLGGISGTLTKPAQIGGILNLLCFTYLLLIPSFPFFSQELWLGFVNVWEIHSLNDVIIIFTVFWQGTLIEVYGSSHYILLPFGSYFSVLMLLLLVSRQLIRNTMDIFNSA